MSRKKKEEPRLLDLAHDLLDPAKVVKSKPKRRGPGTGNFKKKIHSHGLGIHPNQIKQVAKEDRKRGVQVEYDGRGQPVFDNSAHFRRYCKAYGLRHMGYT